MALQVTKTNDNGLTVSYWRVKELELKYDDSWENTPSGQLFRFTVEGYHNADYRDNDRGVEAHQYIVTGSNLTNIISTTSGDLRPAIYDYLKATDDAGSGIAIDGVSLSSNSNQLGGDFFITATDV